MTTNVPRPQFYRLAYSNNLPSRDQWPTLHQVRDGTAFCEVAAALYARGWNFASTIHLYANGRNPIADYPVLTADHTLVLTTRPPMDDLADAPQGKKNRKVLLQNGGDLEKTLFSALRRYFATCRRGRIQLAEHARGFLAPADAALAHFEVAMFMNSAITRYVSVPPPGKSAKENGPERYQRAPAGRHVGFLLQMPALAGLRCRAIVSFGMDGFTTLVWNRMLRTRYAGWLDTHRFVMGVFRFQRKHEAWRYSEVTPEFADQSANVELEVVAEERL